MASAGVPSKKRIPRICWNSPDGFAARSDGMMKIKPAQVRLMRSLRGQLVVNPAVSFFQAVAKADGRLPTHEVANFRVVAVATVDTFGRLQIVNALEFHAGNFFHQIDQAIDRDQLVAANVERTGDGTLHHQERAFEAIIDVHEAARLLTVAPDLDFILTG